MYIRININTNFSKFQDSAAPDGSSEISIENLETNLDTNKFIFQDSAAPDGSSEISIEKLETQLVTLKTMFAEKQRLVADLEAYGSGTETGWR